MVAVVHGELVGGGLGEGELGEFGDGVVTHLGVSCGGLVCCGGWVCLCESGKGKGFGFRWYG